MRSAQAKYFPNGQIVNNSAGLVETLEAVKEEYDAALAAGKAVGLGCAMKNAGVGVGIPDTGRVKLIVEEDENFTSSLVLPVSVRDLVLYLYR